MLIWRHLLANFVAFSTPEVKRGPIVSSHCFRCDFCSASGISNLLYTLYARQHLSVFGQTRFELTIPARVRFGFLKGSRSGSKGNSFEDIHRAEKTEADVLSLHAATLCLYHSQLETQSENSIYFQSQYETVM